MNIDTHVHVIPSGLLFSEYLQAKETDLGYGYKTYTIWGKRISPAHPALIDPTVHFERMETEGIDCEVLSIPGYVFGYEKDASFGRDWARAYNDALSEWCTIEPNKFVGLGTLPMQDIPSALEELRHCMCDLKFAGVEIATQVNGEDLDSDCFAPLFSAANEYGCAVLIHPFNVPAPKRMKVYYVNNLVGNPTETALTATRMLLSGFFEKYPNIRVCFSHGGGAFPFIYSRIKHGFSVRSEPHSAGVSSIDIPSNMYVDSIVFEKENYRFLSQTMGISQICLGSDYPFDMQLSEPIKKMEGWCSTEEEAQCVLSQNAANWLFGEKR